MIKSAGRWDWWEIPIEWAKQLPPAFPGVVVRANGKIEVHRTALPILRDLGLIGASTEKPTPEIDGKRGVTFRPWQRRAHSWVQPRRGSLIIAEPRMGKTSFGLSVHDPATGPLVVLAPLDVRQVWCDWIKSMFGEEPLCLEGKSPDLDAMKHAPFVFAHYDIVVHQRVTSITPGTLIVDEAHLLSNPKSQRSEGVRFFAGNAKRVLTLTGTPLWNSVKGLWPLLATTNPGAWGAKPFDFMQRYASPTVGEYGWVYGEISNDHEWKLRRDEVVFEANWKTERPDLEPTRRRFVDVPIDADVVSFLDDAAAELVNAEVEDTTITTINRYRQLTGKLKIPAAVDYTFERDTPVVLWAWHKDVAKGMADAVKKAGRPAFIISGADSVKKRLAAIEAWRNTPNGALAATLAVGQVGIDLSHAPRAFVGEIDWTPAVIYQGEMRTFTPDRVMEICYGRANHPVERMLVDKLLVKLARAESSAMPAAGSGFDLSGPADDQDALLAALDALLARAE